jgi:hypothetical protein
MVNTWFLVDVFQIPTIFQNILDMNNIFLSRTPTMFSRAILIQLQSPFEFVVIKMFLFSFQIPGSFPWDRCERPYYFQ